MVCPALAAWDRERDVPCPGLGANRSEGDRINGDDSGYAIGDERCPLEEDDPLAGMEGFNEVEFWEEVGQDPTLWELLDETPRVEENLQETVSS